MTKRETTWSSTRYWPPWSALPDSSCFPHLQRRWAARTATGTASSRTYTNPAHRFRQRAEDMATMNPVQFVALGIAVAGCVCDLRTRRIPNVLTFGAAAAGLVYHLSTGGAGALGQSALGWLVGVLAFIVP